MLFPFPFTFVFNVVLIICLSCKYVFTSSLHYFCPTPCDSQCLCVRVIRPSRTTSWLIVPRSAPVVTRQKRRLLWESVAHWRSPVTAPSHPKHAHSPVSPPLSSLSPYPPTYLPTACFLQLACEPKHTLPIHAEPSPEKLRP